MTPPPKKKGCFFLFFCFFWGGGTFSNLAMNFCLMVTKIFLAKILDICGTQLQFFGSLSFSHQKMGMVKKKRAKIAIFWQKWPSYFFQKFFQTWFSRKLSKENMSVTFVKNTFAESFYDVSGQIDKHYQW